MAIPEHLMNLHMQRMEAEKEEKNDASFWLDLFARLDLEEMEGGRRVLYDAVRRLVYREVERCRQLRFEEEEHG